MTTEPITLENFNNSFNVRIVDYKVQPNSSNVSVYYEVRCFVNNRVSVHVAVVDVTQLSEGYTTNDVIETGWQLVKDTVNSWATSNVTKTSLSIFTPATTTNAISLSDFNNNFIVRMARFELYPQVQPSSWCIGFHVYSTTKDNISMYFDCSLSIEQYCNDTRCLDIATAAWETLKDNICGWAATEFVKTNLLNTTYTPTDITPSV